MAEPTASKTQRRKGLLCPASVVLYTLLVGELSSWISNPSSVWSFVHPWPRLGSRGLTNTTGWPSSPGRGKAVPSLPWAQRYVLWLLVFCIQNNWFGFLSHTELIFIKLPYSLKYQVVFLILFLWHLSVKKITLSYLFCNLSGRSFRFGVDGSHNSQLHLGFFFFFSSLVLVSLELVCSWTESW